MNENGKLRIYGDNEEDYLTDVIVSVLENAMTFQISSFFLLCSVIFQRDKALAFLSKQSTQTPFFAILAPPAPHEPFTAAKRHLGAFENINALRTPSFNIVSDVLDKHWLVRMPPAPLPQSVLDTIDLYYRQRWQALLAVDEMIDDLVKQLKSAGFYDNTYIIFTSDNGYHMGQFSMPYDKRQPYETDIRVPFIVIGPNIKPKTTVDRPIALIDLAPTIFQWAKVEEPSWLDGQSFAGILDEIFGNNISPTENDSESKTNLHNKYERKLLIQYWGEGTEATYNPACQWPKEAMLSVIHLYS